MARSKTTFGKLLCPDCKHKVHLLGVCPRKDCGCIYPLDQKPDAKTDALEMEIMTRAKAAEMAGRYTPPVKIKPVKIEHKSRRNRKKSLSSKHSTGQKGKQLIVEHKSTLGKAALGKTATLFKGRRLAQ